VGCQYSILYTTVVNSQMILVTGAALRPGEGPGIGFATALAALRAGHRVGLLDISERGLAGALEALRSKGFDCRTARADVGDGASVTAAVEALTEDSPATAVVNAAALTRTARSFVPYVTMRPKDIDAAVRVNVLGVLNVVRAVLPTFLSHSSGVVVNVGSISAKYPATGIAVYAMTKAAVASVTRSLAAEYGRRGVHVQGIAPGFVGTGLMDLVPRYYRRALVDGSVAGRPAEPHEIARAVLAVVEDPQPLLAGHMVPLDGGLSPFGVRPPA
jgi:3-oxoacyl-[acyl-carrier protein] reductase